MNNVKNLAGHRSKDWVDIDMMFEKDIMNYAVYIYSGGKKVFSKTPTAQVLSLKKMRSL